MILENQEFRNVSIASYETQMGPGLGGSGHIRCLGVIPVEIEALLREIQAEMDAI